MKAKEEMSIAPLILLVKQRAQMKICLELAIGTLYLSDQVVVVPRWYIRLEFVKSNKCRIFVPAKPEKEVWVSG